MRLDTSYFPKYKPKLATPVEKAHMKIVVTIDGTPYAMRTVLVDKEVVRFTEPIYIPGIKSKVQVSAEIRRWN
jgi:hypothetical protein